ncbi:glycosyltransferase family 4 protein [Deferrisoma palaeochoriense]
MRLLIFLDELYFRTANGYASPFNAGRFLLGLAERHELIFSFPVADEQVDRVRYTTRIPADTEVVPLSEWRSTAGYARRHWPCHREVKKRLGSIMSTVDAVWLRLPSLAGLAVGNLARRENLPVLMHMAGDIRYAFKGSKYRGWTKRLAAILGQFIHVQFRSLAGYRRARVFCTGHALLEAFDSYKPWFFLDSEVEPEKSVPNKSRARRFLYVGRLLESKGILLLLDVWRHLESDVELHVVGYGDEADAVLREAERDVRVRFHGFKEGEELADVYRSSDVLILPTSSYPEGFPRVISEAWAFGLAVIATDVGGIRGIGKDRDNIIFVNPGSKEELESAVREIARNDALFQHLSRNGYCTAERVSRSRMLDLIHEVLCDVVDGRGF